MDLALYEPDWGYYMAGARTIGPAGDFVTAPELGDVFGRCLAYKVADTLSRLETSGNVYEFGAGSGRLAVQILNELRRLECPFTEYAIMEVSPLLRNAQRTAIANHAKWALERVKWCEKLPHDGMRGVIIVNEVLDALPVELFRLENGVVKQAFVAQSGDGFKFDYRMYPEPYFEKCFDDLELQDIVEPYTSELHCRANAWLTTLGEALVSGSILIIDYGFPEHEYYHKDRSQGTLICHRRHRTNHDPLAYVGCQDITAHVNFSMLTRVADDCGLEVNGFTTQGAFLLDAGILDMNSDTVSELEHARLMNEVMTLTSLSEMGELFKVMELTRNVSSSQIGFGSFDHRHRL